MKNLAIGGSAGVALVLSGLLVAQSVGAAAVPTTNMAVHESAAAFVAAGEAEVAAQEAARAAAEEARRAELAASRHGILPSQYTGAYFDPRSEATRKCIVQKESGGDYGIVSANGRYMGAYQFMQQTANTTAQRMGRPDLVGVPVNQWTRAEQDQAFWTLWNHGAGRSNWPTARGC
jgi:hypothetical protein